MQARHADGRRRRNPARKAVDSSPAPDSAHKRSPYSACLCLSSFNALRCCCATLLYYLPTRCYWTGDPASVSCTTPKSCLPCIHLYDYLQPAETVPVAVALLPPPSTALFSRLRLDSATSGCVAHSFCIALPSGQRNLPCPYCCCRCTLPSCPISVFLCSQPRGVNGSAAQHSSVTISS